MQKFMTIAAMLVFNSFHVSECQDCYIASGISQEDIDIIVKEHNILRNKVATGGENPPQPSASNMKLMKWNEELAVGAQKWADQCTHFNSAEDDRGTGDFIYVGQSLGEVYGAGVSDVKAAFKTAIDKWYSELSIFDPRDIAPFNYNASCGQYTQMVWAETTDVGCGYSYFEDEIENSYIKMHVCNYGPAGNIQGEIMYEAGAACGDCPNTCSAEPYVGLCE